VDEHVPKLHKAIIAVGGGLGIIASGALDSRFIHDWYTVIALVVGWLVIGFGVVEMWLLVNCSNISKHDAETYRLKAEKEVIIALNSADQQTRAILGVKYPHYNYRWNGQETGMCWQDTDVPIEIFWKFLRESNAQNTIAQRAWKEESADMHRYWITIYEKLVEMELVTKQSSVGPYSEFWSGDGFHRSWDMWPLQIEEME